MEPFLLRWKEIDLRKGLFSDYRARFKIDEKFLFLCRLYLAPLLPLLCVASYFVWVFFALEEKKEAFNMLELKMASSALEKQRYESFFTAYPQTTFFDVERFFSKKKWCLERCLTLKSLPSQGPWQEQLAILEGQRMQFKEGKKILIGPYNFEEKTLSPSIWMEGKDFLYFLEAIEDASFKKPAQAGAGELFFTQFSFKKRMTPTGELYKVRAQIMEKRGAL